MFGCASHAEIFPLHKHFYLGCKKTGQVLVRTLPRVGAPERQ
jgi:hypothetical protein